MVEFNNKKANEIMNGVINTNDFAQCLNQMALVRENVYQILSKTYPEEEVERMMDNFGAPDKPCGVGRADANPKLLLNDT